MYKFGGKVFPIYIYFFHKKNWNTLVIHRILENIVLNIFKYKFWCICTKIRKEKKLNYSKRFFNYIKLHKDFSTLKLYTFKALLSKKSILYPFTHLLTHTNPTIHWDATLLALNLHLTLFKCLTFFKFTIPIQNSDKSNSTRIIFIKVNTTLPTSASK